MLCAEFDNFCYLFTQIQQNGEIWTILKNEIKNRSFNKWISKYLNRIFLSLVEIWARRKQRTNWSREELERGNTKEHKSHHTFFNDHCLCARVEHTEFAVLFARRRLRFIRNLQNNHLKMNEKKGRNKKQLIHTDSVYKFICVLLTIFKVKQFWCLNFKYSFFSSCPRYCVRVWFSFIKMEKKNDCLNINLTAHTHYSIDMCWYVLFYAFFCCFMLMNTHTLTQNTTVTIWICHNFHWISCIPLARLLFEGFHFVEWTLKET